MLIIAIPKSASTSLMATLGELHGIPAQQIPLSGSPPPEGVQALWKYHGDIRELDASLAARFTVPESIFKQHIPPTPNNVKLLRGQPKVVLFRRPEEIILAYRRARRRFISRRVEGFSVFRSDAEWLGRARENGLYQDLQNFVERWSQEPEHERLIIWYDELLRDPSAVINRIEHFWGWEITQGPVELARERYSRGGYYRLAVRNMGILVLESLGLLQVSRNWYRRYFKRVDS